MSSQSGHFYENCCRFVRSEKTILALLTLSIGHTATRTQRYHLIMTTVLGYWSIGLLSVWAERLNVYSTEVCRWKTFVDTAEKSSEEKKLSLQTEFTAPYIKSFDLRVLKVFVTCFDRTSKFSMFQFLSLIKRIKMALNKTNLVLLLSKSINVSDKSPLWWTNKMSLYGLQ